MCDFEEEYGFKEVTLDNVVDPDDVWGHFVDQELDRLTLPGWVTDVSAIKLLECVPLEVRSLFEVSRGALIYGWFFYPLLTLGAEQLFRLLETAARLKIFSIEGIPYQKGFNEAIRTLERHGAIRADEVAVWHEIRELRNDVSHPRIQSILPPGRVVAFASEIAELINALYS